jgi:hypothetical protein
VLIQETVTRITTDVRSTLDDYRPFHNATEVLALSFLERNAVTKRVFDAVCALVHHPKFCAGDFPTSYSRFVEVQIT